MNPYEPPQSDLATPRRAEAASPLVTKSNLLRFGLHLLVAVVICFGLWCLTDYVYVKHDEVSDAVNFLVGIVAAVVTFTLGMRAAMNSILPVRIMLGLLMCTLNFGIQVLLIMSLGLTFHFAIGGTQ